MKYDVAIIGSGPAGLSAGIFTLRAGLKTVCFEKLAIGGQASLSYDIANYPGFEHISGFELTDKIKQQAENLGLEIKFENVKRLAKDNLGFVIETSTKIYKAKKVIIACGCKTRKLGLENELKFTGRGVSYCASCDGNFFKDKVVAVVGGGDTAFQDVEYLRKIAKKIYLLNRSERFKAGDYKLKKVLKYKNVEVKTNTQVKKLFGDSVLSGVEILENEERKKLKIDGLFIAIGYDPVTDFIDIDVDKDAFGYILTDENQMTNVKNLFACGDITSKKFRQVITACSDGAIAGNSCIGG